MNLFLDHRECRNFSNRAKRRYPNEHIEILLGDIEGENIYVQKFLTIPYTATPENCHILEKDMLSSKRKAKRYKMKWLGTIHTHCGRDTCEHLSPTDHISAIEFKEKICGVLLLWPSLSGEVIHSRFSWNLPSNINITYSH